MAAITSATDAADVGLWRENHAATLAERLRRLPAESSAAAPSVAAGATRSRDGARDGGEFEVLDFRRYEAEAERYRRARDASDPAVAAAQRSGRYAADSQAARFVVEVRVAVAESTAQAASDVQAQAVAAAAEASAPGEGGRILAASAGASAYAAQDHDAMRLSSLRAQADSAYRAVGQVDERASLNVFA